MTDLAFIGLILFVNL